MGLHVLCVYSKLREVPLPLSQMYLFTRCLGVLETLVLCCPCQKTGRQHGELYVEYHNPGNTKLTFREDCLAEDWPLHVQKRRPVGQGVNLKISVHHHWAVF